MKLKQYAERINEIAKQYPDVEVIYSSDEEGNSFNKVVFNPQVGKYSPTKTYEEFIPYDEKNKFIDKVRGNKFLINAVCIN